MRGTNKLKKPKSIIRTTIGDYLMNSNRYSGPGIYVIACYPSLGCLYVGQAKTSVESRILQHFDSNESNSCFDFLRIIYVDSLKFRLDILVPPHNDKEWIEVAEREIIKKFRPSFNVQNNFDADVRY